VEKEEEEEEEEGSCRRVEGRHCRGAVAPPWPRRESWGGRESATGKEETERGRERERERGGEELFLPSAGTPWPTLAQLPCIGYADTF